MLADLDTAQKNLNSNPSNEVLLDRFITAGQSTVQDLHANYKDFWTDPAVSILKKEKSKKSEDEEEWK